MTQKNSYLRSMTAYGQGEQSFAFGRFLVEIQSVNRRFLEINVNTPRLFLRFEMEIRKLITKRIGRGQVNVTVSWKRESNLPISVTPNLPLAKGAIKAWKTIAKEIGNECEIGLELLAREKEILLYEEEIEDEANYLQAIVSSTEQALDKLFKMKEEEGSQLVIDLTNRQAFLEDGIEQIRKLSLDAPEKYRQKLSERLTELFSGGSENEEKILREIAIFSEKVDVTEEITRFKSHLNQLRSYLEKPLEALNETRGKTLEFLIQELNREMNTIGAKTSDLTVSKLVVEMKSELEKMREQIQNIE